MVVLEKALLSQWTESTVNAWTELWQVRACGCDVPASSRHRSVEYVGVEKRVRGCGYTLVSMDAF